MKSYIYIAAIATSISTLSSCSENEIDKAPVSNVRVEKTIGVGIPSSTTRAYLDSFDKEHPTYAIYWSETDKITLFAEGHEVGDTFDFYEYSGTFKHHATFKGMTYEAENYTILYPAQSSARLTNEGYVQFNIPSEQKATPGSFDPAAGIQIGHATAATELPILKNAVAYLSFHAEPGLSWVEMKSKTAGWYLSGDVTANPKSGGTLINGFVKGSETITLTGIPAEGGDFVIAFIPSNGIPGFEFTTHSSNGVKQLDFQSKQQFLAGNIYHLGSFN